jgi:hypothetical protein
MPGLPAGPRRPGAARGRRAKSGAGRKRLLSLFFLFFFLFFGDAGLLVGFFIVFLILVIGDNDEVHGMSLRDFELGITFGAAQNFAFFHFIFVEIDFGVAIGTSGHVILSFLGLSGTGRRII